MTVADKVTFLRIILAPVFFTVFLLAESNILGADGVSMFSNAFFLAVIWLLFVVIECSDWFDGMIARSRNEVSDFGKLLDPFADTLVRVMYFLCFVYIRILPVIPFLVILYREFGVLFIRIMMMKKGVAMGARRGGKLKAVFYMLTGLVCLLLVSLEGLGINGPLEILRLASFIIFICAMTISVVSFIDYYLLYRRTAKK